MFPINDAKPGVSQIKVDMVEDVFCVSNNGQYPFFAGERFTGGVSVWHEKLKVRNLQHIVGLQIQADNHRECTESAWVFPTLT